jgi:hypothetical protein
MLESAKNINPTIPVMAPSLKTTKSGRLKCYFIQKMIFLDTVMILGQLKFDLKATNFGTNLCVAQDRKLYNKLGEASSCKRDCHFNSKCS